MRLRDEAIKAMANGRWYGKWDDGSIEQIEQKWETMNVAEDEAASLDGLLDWLEQKGADQPDFAWIDPTLIDLLRGKEQRDE